MLTRQQAREIAARWLRKITIPEGDEVVINEGSTMETDFGWIFFWTLRSILDSPDYIGGNKPLFVDMLDGSVTVVDVFPPFEPWVKQYEILKGHRKRSAWAAIKHALGSDPEEFDAVSRAFRLRDMHSALEKEGVPVCESRQGHPE